MEIVTHAFKNFTKKDKEIYLEACKYLSEGLKNPLFKILVLSHEYPIKLRGRPTQMIKGFYNCELTNQQVYDLVMSGKDLYGPADGDLDVKVRLYYSWRSVYAYTTAGSIWVNLNKRYFRRRDPKYTALTLFHELTHNMGLEHTYKWHSLRKYSAPYALDNIMEKVIG